MSSSYKLTYFDLRGRAEIIRLVLNTSRITYEEERIPHADWPGEYKAQSPYGQLPYIEIDGRIYSQSLAIARFLAKQNGLYGETGRDALLIDEVVGLNDDYFMKWVIAYFHSHDKETKQKGLQKLTDVELPIHLKHLENILAKNSTGYYVSNKISLADLASYDVLENGYRDRPELFNDFPNVLNNRNTIRASAGLRSYLDTRKVTPF